MQEIQLLDEATIEKIAAGEVVERPSSVVKELVENAIDAKATCITVEIKEGGTTFLRITDNGCGIEKDQVRLAFLRHSTSKIRSMEDLLCVKSLGFRGEALASISAVAQVELITRPRGALTGVRYVIEGSKEKVFEEVGAPEGTTFLVRNLFFNTPVRRKFLKSAQTEGSYIATIMERLALSHPEISFQLIVNHQQKLHTSGNCNQKDIIYHIYGKDIAANLLEVDGYMNAVRISGYIGKPLISRGNRNFENYYINGRYMKSQVVAKAIEDAYHSYLMQHQYPFTVLHISMDEELMDVNVHPTKMEVRFSNGELLYEAVKQTLLQALQQRELVPEISFDNSNKNNNKVGVKPNTSQHLAMPKAEAKNIDEEIKKAPERTDSYLKMERSEVQDKYDQIRAKVAEDSSYERKYEPPQRARQEQKVLPQLHEEPAYQTSFLQEIQNSNVRVIGQLFDTYWLTEADEKLFIIDQHAAHEKVLFERNMKRFKAHDYTSQQVSPPVILSLTPQEQQVLLDHMSELSDMGFEISEFGGREYAIDAVPDNLYGLDAKTLFLELLDDLLSDASGSRSAADTTELLWNRVATASCKAAIKGNQRISGAEIEALLQELLTLEQPYHCPHGRPTMISMTKYELEKKFKRII